MSTETLLPASREVVGTSSQRNAPAHLIADEEPELSADSRSLLGTSYYSLTPLSAIPRLAASQRLLAGRALGTGAPAEELAGDSSVAPVPRCPAEARRLSPLRRLALPTPRRWRALTAAAPAAPESGSSPEKELLFRSRERLFFKIGRAHV